MPVWEELRERISIGDVPAVLKLLEPLDDAGCKEVARELPAFVRSRDNENFWRRTGGVELNIAQNTALKAAGAACLPPAAATTWLFRRDLEIWRTAPRAAEAVLQAASLRPVSWRADVGRRMAGRLRLRDMVPWEEEGGLSWEVAARLLASAGEAPATDDAFVIGWLVWRCTTPRGQDPFFPALVPFLFEAEGVGARLADERPEQNGTWSRTGSWIGKLLAAADSAGIVSPAGGADGAQADAAVSRETLLDGCVRRFLRGGRARNLAWFVRLHQALAPSVEESSTRVRDYVRLLAAAPTAVADLAFAQVKAVDERTPLDGGLFAETAEAMLFRPEAKLVKAVLVWLDRTARARGREAAVVGFAAGLFGHERPEVRERAVKLAVKYAAKVDPLTAETVREAASVLPGTLLPLVAEAFGAVEAAEPQAPPVLYAPVPTDLPGPIASPAELVEETALHLHDSRMSWPEMERLLAGLVTVGPAAAEELRQHVQNNMPYLLHRSHLAHFHGHFLLVHLLLQHQPSRFLDDYRSSVLSQSELSLPAPARLLRLRFLDAAACFGAPVLLATPTSSTGHLDPDVFAARLRTLEETGLEPGQYDLEQALLRLPVGTDRVPALDGLSSPAAARARAWLAEGGYRAPDLACGFITVKRRHYSWSPTPAWTDISHFHAAVSCDSPLDAGRLIGTIARPPEKEEYPPGHHGPWAPWWPAILPSHRELVAAHLLHQTATRPYDSYDPAAVLPALADATGPTGSATAAVLLHGLGSERAADRAGAVDALLSFAAQGALPAVELGRLLPSLLEAGSFPLTRLLPPLTEAVRAGAPLWPFFAEAVPVLLPLPGASARSGLASFLALATTTAEIHHVREALPALADWTPASPSSRPAKEAVRLRRTLAAP
ncbi:DUF6493 family protein [Actinocorallia populi]|uniref:DUF6493 family protein n=1 Tax=Actinocorallia populi TaxID=2079200 RepID=UPI000D0949E2|nr:DUF6493 family protein [Actinocorallia populi]